MAAGAEPDDVEGMRLRLKPARIEMPPRVPVDQPPVSAADLAAADPKTFPATLARLGHVIDRLPTKPFTAHDFADHALGLCVLRHSAEVDPVLAYLVTTGVIEPCAYRDEPAWMPVRWTDGRSRERAELDQVRRASA